MPWIWSCVFEKPREHPSISLITEILKRYFKGNKAKKSLARMQKKSIQTKSEKYSIELIKVNEFKAISPLSDMLITALTAPQWM